MCIFYIVFWPQLVPPKAWIFHVIFFKIIDVPTARFIIIKITKDLGMQQMQVDGFLNLTKAYQPGRLCRLSWYANYIFSFPQ